MNLTSLYCNFSLIGGVSGNLKSRATTLKTNLVITSLASFLSVCILQFINPINPKTLIVCCNRETASIGFGFLRWNVRFSFSLVIGRSREDTISPSRLYWSWFSGSLTIFKRIDEFSLLWLIDYAYSFSYVAFWYQKIEKFRLISDLNLFRFSFRVGWWFRGSNFAIY